MITISKDELQDMLNDVARDIVLIDVLKNDAFREQHIPMSINIPADQPQFVQMVTAVSGGKDREIVVYSGGLNCTVANHAARKLQEAGFERVYNFQGGNAQWFEHKQPSFNGDPDLQKQHQDWLKVVGGSPKTA